MNADANTGYGRRLRIDVYAGDHAQDTRRRSGQISRRVAEEGERRRHHMGPICEYDRSGSVLFRRWTVACLTQRVVGRG